MFVLFPDDVLNIFEHADFISDDVQNICEHVLSDISLTHSLRTLDLFEHTDFISDDVLDIIQHVDLIFIDLLIFLTY